MAYWTGQLSNTVSPPTNSSRALTFADDVGPILRAKCVACHVHGGSAPFPLVDYADVSRRAEQILEVTGSGYMPPWLPSSSDYHFANNRSLTPDQIAAIASWNETGKQEGDLSKLRVIEEKGSAWHLGEPDLVLSLDNPYRLQADGEEVFWNFVLPADADDTFRGSRYVRTVEIQPGNRRAVHHIVGLVDRTGDARRRNQISGNRGFEGMDLGQAEILNGQSMLWSPGRVPSPGIDGIAWQLDARHSVVLQMHLFPTGKVELIQPRVGIYFADSKPTRHPISIMLEAPEIDIPAGASAYEVRDQITLPVDVQVLSLYPHAHYLGKKFECSAEFPDGTHRTLLEIDDWDFSWQDEYQFATPVELPRGSTIAMKWTYDNSTGNVRNPNDPPRRVVLGNKTTDEMGSLLLQVLPASEADSMLLDESRWRQKLATTPMHPVANQNLGTIYEQRGDLREALRCYQRVLQVWPQSSTAHENVAVVLSAMGQDEQAESYFRQAIELNPNDALPHNHWGAILIKQGRIPEAIKHLRRALEIWAEFPEALVNLGEAELIRGNLPQAAQQFRLATKAAPEYALAHFNLGTVLMEDQEYPKAAESFRKAIAIDPDFVEAFNNLGIALFQSGKLEEAAVQFRRAIDLDPDYENPRQNLKTLQRQLQ